MKTLKSEKKLGSIILRELRNALRQYVKQRMSVSGTIKISIAADRIFVQCHKAISSPEIQLGKLKAGRLLLQQVSERRCAEARSELGTILYGITGLRLVDIRVAIFFQRREKVYVLAMSEELG
jgi:uncharacterized protein YbcI